MLSGGKPARAINGGPRIGTEMLAKAQTVWTSKVPASALAQRGTFNVVSALCRTTRFNLAPP